MVDVTSQPVDAEPVSIFQSDLSVEAKLESARTELLDLSARNRLLSIPRSAKSTKTLEIVDELSDEIYRLLVGASRPFTFLAGKSATEGDGLGTTDEIVDLAQPEDDGLDERGIANRHADTRLQTRLTPAGLQKKLLDLYADARTLEEEQGVNILFLALGTLKWIDPKDATNIRYAPLVLVPVSLERGNAAEKFKLRWRQEEVAANLSLETALNRIHGVRLPTFEADDGFKPSEYAARVAEAIAGKPGWSVQADDVVLGFFSFAKFLMYRDLDAAVWPQMLKITERPLIRSLLSDGFDEADDLLPEDEPIDPRIAPGEMLHIVDSDSSQTLAIHEVRRARNLVIQGPPGTGKSQTIANIIASAVADGKTVLFVAEKMAALEVVKRRLDATGVGDACLELHSNKANKREVIKELERTWQLGAPKGEVPGALVQRLQEARDRLNAHAERMHRPHDPSGLTPYETIGQLARLRSGDRKVSDVSLADAASWSAEDFRARHDLLNEVVDRIEEIGVPAEHAWVGVGTSALTPMDRDRLLAPVGPMADRLHDLTATASELAAILERPAPATLAEIDGLAALADRVAGAPPLESSALASGLWVHQKGMIDALLDAGAVHQSNKSALGEAASEEGWSADAAPLREALAVLPDTFRLEDFADAQSVVEKLPSLLEEGERLAGALGLSPATILRGLHRQVRVAERVASAPPASPEVFAAELWSDGVERAGDLAEAVAKLEEARAFVGDRVSEAAWSLDLASARATLAASGASLFRFLSGEWRGADKLVRSVLANPKTPLADLLPLLDALGRGRSALSEVRTGEEFGAKAFGGAWRGERSKAEPLLSLVEWMRSLSDLGAEPRLIAARRPDQDGLRDRGEKVASRLAEFQPGAERLWTRLGDAAGRIFGEANAVDQSDLAIALPQVSALVCADRESRRLLTATPLDLAERRRLLALLIEARAASDIVQGNGALGREALAGAWSGLDSDWTALKAYAQWLQANPNIRGLASRIADRSKTAARTAAVAADRGKLLHDLDRMGEALRLDRAAAFGGDALDQQPIHRVANRLARWRDEPEALSTWAAYRDRALEARSRNLAIFVERLERGALPTREAAPLFELSVYEAVLNDMVAREPEIGQFSGFLHSRLVNEFVDLDLKRIVQARLEVVRSHHRRIPPQQGGAIGPLGVLRGEIARPARPHADPAVDGEGRPGGSGAEARPDDESALGGAVLAARSTRL